MIKKRLSGLAKPRIEYIPLQGRLLDPVDIKTPPQITLLIKDSTANKNSAFLKEGDTVKTGQKLSLHEAREAYVISTVTGTVTGLSPYTGDFGWSGTAISIKVADTEEVDENFTAASKEPTLDTAIQFLACTPGNPPLSVFSDSEKSIHTIVVNGVDKDQLVVTNQFVLQTKIESVTRGIQILKKITGIDNVVLVVPLNILAGYGEMGAKVKAADSTYPSGLPKLIMKDVLGQVVPAGKRCEDMGVAFFNAETVALMGDAFDKGQLPVSKLITLIHKDSRREMLRARIGTPISQIFKVMGITLNDMDRVIFGGPMTGISLYSEDHPIEAHTDAIMVQDKDDLPYITDYPCINCGECIRTCPVKVPVDMLVRFLEAGHYEEAAEQYDLNSCVECGLCSFVCVARIPIFQYIMLAKYELSRTDAAEAANA